MRAGQQTVSEITKEEKEARVLTAYCNPMELSVYVTLAIASWSEIPVGVQNQV